MRPALGRRTGLSLSVLLLAGLAGCAGSRDTVNAPPPPAVQHRNIDVAGVARSYRLFVPLSMDRRRQAPLVLVLGGVGNTGESMVQATDFDRVAETEQFIVAYPDGLNKTWNAGYCCLGGEPTGPDDVDFLRRVIDHVQEDYQVDPARVFAVGVSAGAMMAYRLGCDLAGRIAGVGSVAGAMILEECRPSRPVPVIEIHGTADPLVPFEGGPTAGGATQPSPPTVAVAQRWAELNRCPDPPSVHTEAPVTTTTWSGCAEGTAVKLVTVEGGGHTWYAPGLGPANGAVDATRTIWSFLSGLSPRG